MTDLGPNKSANEGPESENFERYDSFLVARAPGLRNELRNNVFPKEKCSIFSLTGNLKVGYYSDFSPWLSFSFAFF